MSIIRNEKDQNINQNTNQKMNQYKNNDKSIIINRYAGNTPAVFNSNSYFTIAYIFEGNCTQNIDLKQINLCKGDIMIVSPNTVHAVESFDDDGIMFEILLKYENFYDMFAPLMKGNHIFNKFFSESLHDRNPIKYLLFHTAADDFLRDGIIKMFEDQKNRDDYINLFMTGNLIINAVYLMRNYSDQLEIYTGHRSNLPDTFLVMSYIQENLATVSLADVASHFNFSVSHCSRLIKSTTGHGFSEWKRTLRLRKAQYLLINTKYSSTEIANFLGYQNLESFIRTFQKEFNMTPVQYRKKILFQKVADKF